MHYEALDLKVEIKMNIDKTSLERNLLIVG